MNRRILALAASISMLGCVTATGDGESTPATQETNDDGGAFAPAADPVVDSGSADSAAPQPSDEPSEEPAEPADSGADESEPGAPDASAPTTPKDSGTASKDSGTSAKDTGTATPKDSGTVSMDTGTATPKDSGTTTPKDSGSAADTSVADTATGGGTVTPKYVKHELTFYGWPDNDPPGGNIAYPKLHSKAGGTGTYADPITFATATAEFAPGTILYVPMLQKYVIMEDLCAACTSDWSSGKRHIDVWMNSDGTNNAKLLTCQYSWTRPSVDVEISPPNNRPVSTVPLFEPKTGVCQPPPA